MGTSSRTSSASRSRSPRDIHGPASQNIPEIFRTQRSNMAASSSAATPAQSLAGITLTPTELPPAIPAGTQPPIQQPSLNDLHTVAADIKNTLFAAITDLRHEIQAITGRVLEVERTAAQQHTTIRKVNHTVDTHTLQLRDLQRHVEDLDNRGRRHNLRVRGLPKSVAPDRVRATVTELFNQLLDQPRQKPIAMERIHRALRPRGRDSDPPRDIVCHIDDFQIKEDILRKARTKTTNV